MLKHFFNVSCSNKMLGVHHKPWTGRTSSRSQSRFFQADNKFHFKVSEIKEVGFRTQRVCLEWIDLKPSAGPP